MQILEHILKIRREKEKHEFSQMVFRIAKFAVVFRIAKFRIAKFATHCEQFAKIPTVLPSDFVLRITFSSELRFRRFWYRWKA